MRVLVTYGSKRGGTEGLARVVGEGLTDAGHVVSVLPAKSIDSVDRYDSVVVGGALYLASWHKDARRFVKRHLEELQQRPVWFFSSGPLDDSARDHEVAPPRLVARLARLVGVQQHKTFGGRLTPGVNSALATRGDFRDLPGARTWARKVGVELTAIPVQARSPVPRAMSAVHRLVLWLCMFTGVTAVAGGLALLGSPSNVQGLPGTLLERTPFSSFLIPGLLLSLVVGLVNLVAAALEAQRIEHSELAVTIAGAALTVWIGVELAMIRTVSWLQLIYFLVGVVTCVAAVWLWRVRHRLAGQRHLPPG